MLEYFFLNKNKQRIVKIRGYQKIHDLELELIWFLVYG